MADGGGLTSGGIGASSTDASASPAVLYEVTAFTEFPRWDVGIQQTIGGRRTQEDRFAVCPHLHEESAGFFGVWDGTVDDFAADQIRFLVLPAVLRSPHWAAFQASKAEAADGATPTQDMLLTLEQCMREAFIAADDELVQMCRERSNHYSSCTGVVVLIVAGVLTVAHLGDSRAALGSGSAEGGALRAEFLTVDHKPDQPPERQRIEQSGGSVEYLHDVFNKPFIRGGDFTERKARGEKPMQLQYSRAFGGKDLKPYGLSNIPDVKQVMMSPQHRVLVIASDGLWDVCSEATAVSLAMEARQRGQDACHALIQHALGEHARLGGTADNVTVVIVFFK
ncbi:unnamed protein product [Polarella glacialis]|uniref:PPM-type phosphatase domain-containing protein n=1 Tax=Polarella glacialis TaxID=89957 RepID=A0A813FSR5_POLGL|nr:unnamed protein product [Polarella glacialis]